MENLDYNLIPEGLYCNGCPHYSYVLDENIKIPFCLYLKEGDVMGLTDIEHDILENKYKSLDKIMEIYPCTLLWDGCKECYINLGLDDD